LKKHWPIAKYVLLLLQAIPLSAVPQTKAQDIWAIEFLSGATICIPTALRIRQSGEEDIGLNARYKKVVRSAFVLRPAYRQVEMTLSFSCIPVQDGSADVTNLTFHGIIGLKYSL
jgi:hypothetical protein